MPALAAPSDTYAEAQSLNASRSKERSLLKKTNFPVDCAAASPNPLIFLQKEILALLKLQGSQAIRWPTIFMVVIGLGFLTYSAIQALETMRFVSRSQAADGVVVDQAAHPRIRFTAQDGTQIEFVQNGFLSRGLNAHVRVLFDQNDPSGTARSATFWSLWGSVLWCLLPGLGFVFLPLIGATFDIVRP